ncbi:hypothetical protein MXB_369 [Myxobolus squamalis]|nr:hypothetical protein MXB_369 [Myxobolus squamalis]
MSKTKLISKLEQELLKEASKFKCYYYRKYFDRKIKHLCTETKENINSVDELEKFLAMIKRQVIIDNMYSSNEWFMDNLKK